MTGLPESFICLQPRLGPRYPPFFSHPQTCFSSLPLTHPKAHGRSRAGGGRKGWPELQRRHISARRAGRGWWSPWVQQCCSGMPAEPCRDGLEMLSLHTGPASPPSGTGRGWVLGCGSMPAPPLVLHGILGETSTTPNLSFLM